MKSSYILNMSAEDRLVAVAKAREGREAAKAVREANKQRLKMHYLDEGNWATLATSMKVINSYLKKCGVSYDEWNDHYTSRQYFLENNPLWTAYATVGLILELRDAHNT